MLTAASDVEEPGEEEREAEHASNLQGTGRGPLRVRIDLINAKERTAAFRQSTCMAMKIWQSTCKAAPSRANHACMIALSCRNAASMRIWDGTDAALSSFP